MEGPVHEEVLITHEAYVKAMKRLQEKAGRESYMTFKLSYDLTIVLPFKDGLTFMAALEKAESLHDRYSEPKRITEMKRDAVEAHILPPQEYLRIKIAGLLNVKPEDLKDFDVT